MKRRDKKKFNSKNKYILGAIILVVLISAILFTKFYSKVPEICIEDKKCFKVEIADSEAEQALGLSGRDSLDEDEGMLFVFQETKDWGFWMVDMEFPLDIIWIDDEGKIVAIGKNLNSCLNAEECPIYYSGGEVRYVLEINSGLADKYNFGEGNVVFRRE